ncbi:hypothetical protein BJY01DRAFT_226529 [Aspergillus pseudoustus]|uniref:Transcription factor domain-containing protein n=1 Tax=Aspergillus pseudoustus TaxID=1810923 RepID=A0ABR4IV04_9EURO
MIVYTPATPAYPSAEAERDAFRFFLAQSRGCFPADFSRAVLQAAQLDRVFTHAIVSFGAAQQIYEYEDDPATRDRLGNLAMMQYGKALHLLQNPVHPCSVEVLLLCCVLFACFESLRGCRRSAVVHIKSGLDLLRQSGGPQAKWSLVSRETMTAIFTRLDNQIVELLGTHVNETVKDDKPSDKVYYPGPLTVKLPVSDLGISIDTHLNHLFHRQLRLALIAGGRLPTPDDSPTSAETPIALGRQKALFKTEDLDTALLQIWQLMAELYITVETGSEDAWDPFIEDFATIVRLSEAYLSRERHVLPSFPTFFLE